MENSEFDETQPTNLNQPTRSEPDAEAAQSSLAASTPSEEVTREVKLGDTMPVQPGQGQTAPVSGLEETIPPPPVAVPAWAKTAQMKLAADSQIPTTVKAYPPQEPGKTAVLPGSPASPPSTGKKRRSWLAIALLGLLALLLIAALSGLGGYQSGISMRKNAEATQISGAVEEQFQLGLKDLEDKNYYQARQRFEYVIGLNPNYPGAVEKLAEALMYLNTTATPTLVPTPTPEPTADLRGVEELYNQAQQAVLNSEWATAIEALLSLRKTDPNYRPVDVDGMLFLSYRNQGGRKILNADLEGGIYDLTLASRLGILDAEAQGLLTWAELYITGASFWEIDWGQAAYYFGQVAPHAPNLRDGSGITAVERYRTSLIKYANQLANQKKWCEAAAQLEIALSIAEDPEVRQTYAQLAERCNPQQPIEPTQPSPGP
ncbi:MAG: hypothetical protein JXB15_17480 [Anaerolineales bacterium]|nr:hypothetical protein [Anaerolineales bacterium]